MCGCIKNPLSSSTTMIERIVAELTGSDICAANALEPTGQPLAINCRTSATRVSRHRFDNSLCPFILALTDKLIEKNAAWNSSPYSIGVGTQCQESAAMGTG